VAFDDEWECVVYSDPEEQLNYDQRMF